MTLHTSSHFIALYIYQWISNIVFSPFLAILTEVLTTGCASECPKKINKWTNNLPACGGFDVPSLSAGMYMTTWVENMRMCWRSWWHRCALSASPSSGWDPVRWCWSGRSSTVSASTLSCGPPSSSPWSLLFLLRFVCGGYITVLTTCFMYINSISFAVCNVRSNVPPDQSHL